MITKDTIISISIAIIFVLFIGYGIEVFDPTPEFDDLCPRDLFDIKTEEECTAQGGEWNGKGRIPESPEPVGSCGPSKQCYRDHEDLRSNHDKIVFIAAVIIGLIAAVGGMILKKAVISTGFVSGGVLLILYGTIRYWRHANSTLKFILLGVALAVLIWVAYTKLDRRKKVS